MSYLESNPTTPNFLNPIGFRFVVQRLPNVNYFCTTASIPDVTLSSLSFDTPFVNLPKPGDKLSFSPLKITFKIDEGVNNYTEIFDWMVGLGYPEGFDQRYPQFRRPQTNNEMSDASLIIYKSNYVPVVEIKFSDLFPISLSALDFNLDTPEIDYISATAIFAYKSYKINKVT